MTEARIVLSLCDRFGCTPREALKQDARVLRLIETENIKGWRKTEGGE